MQAQGLVHGMQPPEGRPDALHRDRANLLGLRLESTRSPVASADSKTWNANTRDLADRVRGAFWPPEGA
jgi:hypothetical protein